MPDDITDGVTDEERDEATDPLQPADDIFNPNIDEEQLEEDNNSPAAPAADPRGGTQLPPDHPEFDTQTDQDSTEAYDEGRLGATDANAQEGTSPEEPVYPLEPTDDDDDVEAA